MGGRGVVIHAGRGTKFSGCKSRYALPIEVRYIDILNCHKLFISPV